VNGSAVLVAVRRIQPSIQGSANFLNGLLFFQLPHRLADSPRRNQAIMNDGKKQLEIHDRLR
jgi:hypothetical protein